VYLSVSDRGVQSFEILTDVSVAIAGHSGFKGIGVQSNFDTRVQNVGPYSASDVKVAIQLPNNLQNVAASIDRGTCSVINGSVNCTVPYIQKDELIAAHISYTSAVAGALDVRASVTMHERDLAAANNEAIATATVAELVDVGASISAAPGTVTVGDAVTYTINVTNAGPNISSTNRVTIQLPAGVAVSGVTPSTCTTTNLVIECNLGAMNAAATATITVSATTNAAGILQATVTAAAASTAVETNSANNSASSTVSVNAKPISGGGSAGGGGSSGGGGGGGGGGSWEIQWLCALLALKAVTRAVRRRSNLNI
jgi:uncharacterized repeat protein (TIGR01451 family)